MQSRIWDKLKDWVMLGVCLVLSFLALLYRNEPVVRTMRAASLQATGVIETRFAWVGGYLGALDENERLRRDNIEMATELARAREALTDNERLRGMLEYRDTTSYPLVMARIVAKDYGQHHNYFLIDVGTEEGIEDGMAVIDDRGVMGRVILAGAHYSRVMPYLNTDFRLSTRILELGSEGIVRWMGDRPDRITLEHVSRTDPVVPGMRVVTSAYSEVFPPGISVGIIADVQSREGRNALDIAITPSADVQRAAYCFVIRRSPSEERQTMEQTGR